MAIVAATSATHAGVLIALTIVITPAMEGVMTRTPLLPRFYAAVVALLGVLALVAGPGASTSVRGDALILAAAVVRSAHVAASGHLTRGPAYDTLTLTLVQTLVGTVVFTVAAGPAVLSVPGELSAGSWAAVLPGSRFTAMPSR